MAELPRRIVKVRSRSICPNLITIDQCSSTVCDSSFHGPASQNAWCRRPKGCYKSQVCSMDMSCASSIISIELCLASQWLSDLVCSQGKPACSSSMGLAVPATWPIRAYHVSHTIVLLPCCNVGHFEYRTGSHRAASSAMIHYMQHLASAHHPQRKINATLMS